MSGGKPLNQPIVGMAAESATGGYRMVAAGGGIVAFAAPFYGSTGIALPLAPVAGLVTTAAGTGYSVVDTAGYAFGFGSERSS